MRLPLTIASAPLIAGPMLKRTKAVARRAAGPVVPLTSTTALVCPLITSPAAVPAVVRLRRAVVPIAEMATSKVTTAKPSETVATAVALDLETLALR